MHSELEGFGFLLVDPVGMPIQFRFEAWYLETEL